MITQEQLKQLISYDPETGIITALEDIGKYPKGEKLGVPDKDNYLLIKLGRLKFIKLPYVYMAHRLAFLYMEGYEPDGAMTHLNGQNDDNRWCNLGLVKKRSIHVYDSTGDQFNFSSFDTNKMEQIFVQDVVGKPVVEGSYEDHDIYSIVDDKYVTHWKFTTITETKTVAKMVRRKKPIITYERLKLLVNYDPETGVFTSLENKPYRKKGTVLGNIHKRPNGRFRLEISLDGNVYSLPHLAYLYMTGSWTSEKIWHINGDVSDNRWANLSLI